MCTMSMIGDHYREKWQYLPGIYQSPLQEPFVQQQFGQPQVSRAEFDMLKREVEEMKALLKRAKKYDEDNGEPNCEMDEKMAILRKVAEMVGVNLDDVIGKPAA
jgi:hypothetical protein